MISRYSNYIPKKDPWLCISLHKKQDKISCIYITSACIAYHFPKQNKLIPHFSRYQLADFPTLVLNPWYVLENQETLGTWPSWAEKRHEWHERNMKNLFELITKDYVAYIVNNSHYINETSCTTSKYTKLKLNIKTYYLSLP